MIAGFVATLVLSGVMYVKAAMGLWPHLNIINLLTQLGSIGTVAAWMDHFIVGVGVWGLLFAGYDAVSSRPQWFKGLVFGVFAWLMMMILFMPLAKAGFFGMKLGLEGPLVSLFYSLVYGAVLGTTYGMLGSWAPAKVPESARHA
jgi:hypothetical protein